MNIEIFDNQVPLSTRTDIQYFCFNSKFSLGWRDRPSIDEKSIVNTHCSWNLDELNRSGLLPYIGKCIDKTSWFTKKQLHLVEVNLVRPDDVYYIHTHPCDYAALYYVNMDWEDGWYGETIFYNSQNLDEVLFTSVYKPGRIILFDGSIPHAIRPQSIKAPKYRMSLTLFFNDNE